MTRICCACKRHFGEAEPLENTAVTHGYCSACYKKTVLDVQEWLRSIGSQAIQSGPESGLEMKCARASDCR